MTYHDLMRKAERNYQSRIMIECAKCQEYLKFGLNGSNINSNLIYSIFSITLESKEMGMGFILAHRKR
jgi:hypothetical protein